MKLLEIVNSLFEEFNYHIGSTDTFTKYGGGTDSLLRMQGRGTGHFGSGTYFSTYKNENPNIDKKYSTVDINNQNLVKVDDKIYRINLDNYKNLYRPTSEQHAQLLFQTLKLLNETFYMFVYDSNIKDEIIKCYHNFKTLGLSLPKYRNLLKIFQEYREKFNKQEGGVPTISTIMMEYNGYNGVNVSGIRGFDNTSHGSVIYDMNNYGGEVRKVKSPGFFDNFKNNIIGDNDFISKILRGDDITLFIKTINDLNPKDQLYYMKNYNGYIYSFSLEEMDEYPRKIYLKSLPKKLESGKIKINKIFRNDVYYWIENGLTNMIYNPNIMVDGETLLSYILSYKVSINDDTKEYLLKNINRELTDDEKYHLE